MNVHITRLRTKILGTIQIAGTSSGVVRIQLDDDGDRMRATLKRQYPDTAVEALTPDGFVRHTGKRLIVATNADRFRRH